MSQVYLFQLSAQQAHWLSARQTAIASNISNADTPGYKAVDVAPFSEMLDKMQISMRATDPGHMTLASDSQPQLVEIASGDASQTLSGNTVNLEQQLINAGDVNRSYALNMNVTRVFHQMLLSALK